MLFRKKFNVFVTVIVILFIFIGCTNTKKDKENTTLTAEFSAAQVTGNAPLTVQFVDNSTGNITLREWDFDCDGVTDYTGSNPTYTYNTQGTYSVKLTVTGPDGTAEKIKNNYISVLTDTNYVWTYIIGGPDYDVLNCSCGDSFGHIYLSGYFNDVVNFANDWNLEDTKTASGESDIFITKLSSSGTYSETIKIGGSYSEEVRGICTDTNGNVYITGFFNDIVNFATDWQQEDVKISAGYCDAFVTKIDATGNYCWTRVFGGTEYDAANAICADTAGNIYVTGYFQASVNFAADWNLDDIKTCAGSTDVFVVKLTPDGNYEWTYTIGGVQSDGAYAICSHSSGSIYVTGFFSDTVDFGADWGIEDTRTSSGSWDVFVTKIDPGGYYCWSRAIGGTGADIPWSIVTDENDNVYVAGYFEDSVNFANDWNGSEIKTSAGSYDAFITKISYINNYCWTHRIGSTGFDAAYSLCADVNGNIYVSG
ncbi:MAG: SBBP repeat-containing protein, partial [Planctomycetota bacterium]